MSKTSLELTDEQSRAVQRTPHRVEWHDLFKQYPHPLYLAVNDNGEIVSMTDDPEQSQIAGYDIWGIDDAFGETFGPGGTAYGKIWDGKKMIARSQTFPALTARQIRLALLKLGKFDQVDSMINALPSPDKEVAEIEWQYASNFDRHHPLIEKLIPLVGIEPQDVDTFWLEAAKL